ncbi:MAG: hypothetical protein RSA12_10950 [Clostridia bacterium]
MPAKAINPTKSSDSRVMSDVELDAQIERMGAEIYAQPRTPIRLPFNPLDDARDQVQFVGVNGTQFWIPRGVTVDLPCCVIEVLENAGVL